MLTFLVTDLTNADLSGANLTNATLHVADLTNAFVLDADLTNADLNLANLNESVFDCNSLGTNTSAVNVSQIHIIDSNQTEGSSSKSDCPDT